MQVRQDQRWGKVAAFLQWLKESEGARGDSEFLDRWEQFFATLTAIASDSAAAPTCRARAQRMLGELAAPLRAEAAIAIRKVAEIAENQDSPPDIRADARRRLTDITAQMPASSDKRH